MTNQLSNAAFNAALEDKQLIFGVLKQFKITRQHNDFDDYFQECLLAYADAYCKYEQNGSPLSRQNYLYTKVRQRVIDLIRKHDCYQSYFGCSLAAIDPLIIDLEPKIQQELVLQDLMAELTPTESQLFHMLYLQNYSAQETGQKLNVRPSTLYRWRSKLAQKIKNFF
ncbi:sigma-70 family RNA polymerase sigma factor [Loigolactobacillus zhaoyuanensis]|uniref:Sigma-70 family RNA polymerase sigma factor n=1 Tax=Loigolactobacillus zhaoyuanensis TaxID=2486017 RepID=A0ABW8UCX5_9LACO